MLIPCTVQLVGRFSEEGEADPRMILPGKGWPRMKTPFGGIERDEKKPVRPGIRA